MFLYTPSPRPNQEQHTLFQAGTDAVGHLHVQTLRGATVLTSKYTDTHTNTEHVSGKGLGGTDQNP